MPRGTNSATTWIPPHFSAWHQSHTHEVLLLCLGIGFDLGLVFWQVLGFRKPKSPELQALCSFKSCQGVYKTATTWLPAHLLAWQQTYAHVAFTAQPRVRVMFRVRAVPRIRVLPRIRFHKTKKPRVQSMLQIQNACQREQKYATIWVPQHLSASYQFEAKPAFTACLGLKLRLGFRFRKPQSPCTVQLPKPWQGEHNATTWLTPHFSAWHQSHPHEAFTALSRVRVMLRFRVLPRIRVQKTTKPGVASLQKA